MKRVIILFLFAASNTAFAQDSTNTFDYNHRKGMEYYRKGVDSMNKYVPRPTPYSGSMPKQTLAMYRLALPFLEKAHEINPNDRNTLDALVIVVRGTGPVKKLNKYYYEQNPGEKK